MRISQFLAAASLAVSVSAGQPGTGDGAPPTSVEVASTIPTLPVATGVGADSSIHPASNATGAASSQSSQTTTISTSTTHTASQSTGTSGSNPRLNATSSKPADATGGAILPQMQGSMAGLLGFCIMSLIML